MKIIRIIVIIVAIIGGVVLATNKDARKMVSAVNLPSSEYSYRKHHEPAPGCYYSVEAISTGLGNNTFIIGKQIRPEIGGTVSEIGDLREIEIPRKKAGTTVIRKGSFFTVRDVNDEPAAVFFPDATAVVTDAIRH